MMQIRWIFIFLLLFGTIGVASTLPLTSPTIDEDFHIACGEEWWNQGTYTLEALHPPLARVMDGMLPTLDTAFPISINWVFSGNKWDDIPWGKSLIKRISLGRLGTLIAYVFSCIVLFIWARKLYGPNSALWSLGTYVTLSTVTAHAGLATTDMTYTAMLLWALMASTDWLKSPTSKNGALMGLSIGCALGSKFSFTVQYPAAMALIISALMYNNFIQDKKWFPLLKAHFTAIPLYVIPSFVLTLALIYRFDFAPFFKGISDAYNLNSRGYSVYKWTPEGAPSVWFFFPLVFFFKTNLTLFLSSGLGNFYLFKEIRHKRIDIEGIYPLLAATGIMLISMTSHINLGVRHVLPLYPLLAIPAGYGLNRLYQHAIRGKILATSVAAWQLISFADAYPEHIAYFNVLAGRHPEYISFDSDFDWGHGFILLDKALQENHINDVYVCTISGEPMNTVNTLNLLHGTTKSCPSEGAVTGWIAVNRAYRVITPSKFMKWIDSMEPVQQAGRAFDLYYVPPESHK